MSTVIKFYMASNNNSNNATFELINERGGHTQSQMNKRVLTVRLEKPRQFNYN